MHITSTNSWGCLLEEYTILNREFKLLVSVILALATGSAEVNAGLYTSGTSLENLTVFSNTYTTTGDAAIVYGNMLAGGAATVGANSTITGNLGAVGLITISASGKVGSSSIITSPALPGVRTSVIPEADAVSTIQGTMDALGTGTTLAATMTVNTTLNAGIYSAPSLSTTASTSLFLDAQGNDGAEWVFNIVDILHIGAFYNIQIINEGTAENSSVVWNIGGYANIGASSNFIGTIFANTYIMVGANATVTGNGENCAGVYSATSYVSTGSDAVIDGRGCSPTPIDEPFGLLLSGLAALGFVTRRKIQAARAS